MFLDRAIGGLEEQFVSQPTIDADLDYRNGYDRSTSNSTRAGSLHSHVAGGCLWWWYQSIPPLTSRWSSPESAPITGDAWSRLI
jgi:hypothetical protein